MSDQAEDYDSQYSESSSSSESTLHDLLNRPVEIRAQANARQTGAYIFSATENCDGIYELAQNCSWRFCNSSSSTRHYSNYNRQRSLYIGSTCSTEIQISNAKLREIS
jgi:hypothetical protein